MQGSQVMMLFLTESAMVDKYIFIVNQNYACANVSQLKADQALKDWVEIYKNISVKDSIDLSMPSVGSGTSFKKNIYEIARRNGSS